MFGAKLLPILRSIRLYITAVPSDLVTEELKSVPPSPDHWPATYWVQHTTSCNVQSNAPEYGQKFCPKLVEL